MPAVRLLLDMGLPRRTAASLRGAGWDVVHVAEVGLATASDRVILGSATLEHRVIVTLDRDFARLALQSERPPASVILIRSIGLNAQRATTMLWAIVPSLTASLEAGCVVSVSRGQTRVRLFGARGPNDAEPA